MGALVVVASGCAKSPGERLVDRSLVHLQAAIDMLEESAGDERALLDRAMQYRAKHGSDIAQLRTDGEALIATLSEADAKAFFEASGSRSRKLDHQLQELARRFPDPKRALRLVRPLIVQATPKPKHYDEPPWMPKVPEPMFEPPPPAAAGTAP